MIVRYGVHLAQMGGRKWSACGNVLDGTWETGRKLEKVSGREWKYEDIGELNEAMSHFEEGYLAVTSLGKTRTYFPKMRGECQDDGQECGSPPRRRNLERGYDSCDRQPG